MARADPSPTGVRGRSLRPWEINARFNALFSYSGVAVFLLASPLSLAHAGADIGIPCRMATQTIEDPSVGFSKICFFQSL